MGAGGTGAGLYGMSLALFNPDVCKDKKTNPEPWDKLGSNDNTSSTTECRLQQPEERRIRLLNEMFHYKAA